MGAEPQKINSHIEALSICHHNHKRKLFYYDNKKLFVCYNSCGTMDVFKLLENHFNISFTQAKNFICSKFNIDSSRYVADDNRIDMGFIDKFDQTPSEIVVYKPLDLNILDSYYNLFHHSWIDENINTEVMKKFNIKFSIADNQIIIPHYDHKSNLIGIRCRNLNQEQLELGRKYMPVVWHNQQLNHSLGGNLYGLNQQIEEIKKTKTVVIVEAEKSVLQALSFKKCIPTVAICGSTIHQSQIELLLHYGVENIIVAMDKDFKSIKTPEEELNKKKINHLVIQKLEPYFNLCILWDREGLLEEKNSPTDKGEKIFYKLLKNGIKL